MADDPTREYPVDLSVPQVGPVDPGAFRRSYLSNAEPAAVVQPYRLPVDVQGEGGQHQPGQGQVVYRKNIPF